MPVQSAVSVPVGLVTAVDYNDDNPSDHTILERTDRNATHEWEEKAPVSDARYAFDGVELLDGKIYFIGGKDGVGAKNITERYDPKTNQWETLAPMLTPREGLASTFLNGKLYAIGGQDLSSVEIYDPDTNTWSVGVALPGEVNHGTAITVHGKIYLIGGRNAFDQNINQVLCFDPSTNQWTTKANMPTARDGSKLVWFNNRIWAICGGESAVNKIESYDPSSDSWRTEASLRTARDWPVAWVANHKIFVAGGLNANGSASNSIETYDPTIQQWNLVGSLPENSYAADAEVFNGKVYVVAGHNGLDYSDQVLAADLLPHRDLHFRSVLSETVNREPTSIFVLADLTISENQPAGTIVGEFNATDPDGNVITYSLVSGEGDTHNSLFTIDSNGTLKTAATFDYESNASTYTIRVRATDEGNETIEGIFTVSLQDMYEPSQPNHLVDLNATLNMEMIWVEPGSFTMGRDLPHSAYKAHIVTLTNGFYLGKHEVTRAQYQLVMEGNPQGLSATPGNYSNPNGPAAGVSWENVQVFLSRLNEQESENMPNGWRYVLPTEAEWEYSCRAGSTSIYSWGGASNSANANCERVDLVERLV